MQGYNKNLISGCYQWLDDALDATRQRDSQQKRVSIGATKGMPLLVIFQNTYKQPLYFSPSTFGYKVRPQAPCSLGSVGSSAQLGNYRPAATDQIFGNEGIIK